MNAQDIIEMVKNASPEAGLNGWVAALEDGEALIALGITDEDQEAVEYAHAELSADLGRFNSFSDKFGKVKFEGVEYALICQAELSNRVFAGWWGDVSTGEEYTAEYSAPAMGQDGNEFVVRWQFDAVRGEEPEDESSYDWECVNEVIAV